MGDLSPHFSASEFRCHHCGRLPRAGVSPQLVAVLERIRSASGRPLSIVSGYRCPTHNRAVGGAADSQHLRARAADLEGGRVTLAQAAAAGAHGIGIRGGWVTHVDVRPGAPVMWYYD